MIQPSGGRAGVHGLKWLNAGYNLEQIESLRQQLLAQNDIGRVQRAMRAFGITVKRDVIQAVKQYNFDSRGIAFTEENYSAWRRYIKLQTEETQAARHMFVDGVIMKEHHHYSTWRKRSQQFIPLSNAMQQRLGYYVDQIMLKTLIALVKSKPIK